RAGAKIIKSADPVVRPMGKPAARPYLPCMDQNDVFANFSSALAALTDSMRSRVVAIRFAEERHLTGTLLQPGVVVASEQSLPRRDEFELLMPGGALAAAKVAGRDPGTNIALLRLADSFSAPSMASGKARAGALALAFGADGAGGISVRAGVVNLVAP